MFLRFQILEKWANLRLSLNIQKVFQLQGALLPLDQGPCSWTPLGAPPPDLRHVASQLYWEASNSLAPALFMVHLLL